MSAQSSLDAFATAKLAQLEDNLEAGKLKLSAEQLAELDKLSALPGEYPGWMLERQGRARIPQPFEPK